MNIDTSSASESMPRAKSHERQEPRAKSRLIRTLSNQTMYGDSNRQSIAGKGIEYSYVNISHIINVKISVCELGERCSSPHGHTQGLHRGKS